MARLTSILVVATTFAVLVAIVAAAAIFLQKRAELVRLQTEGDALARRIASLQRTRTESARQRVSAETAVKRQEAQRPYAELDAEVAAWFDRITQLKKLVAENPQWTVPELRLLSERQWFDLAREAKFGTNDERRNSLQEARNVARMQVGSHLRRALVAYLDEHRGMLPATVLDLTSYLSPPLDPDILARYEMHAHGNANDYLPGDWLISETTIVDESFGTRLGIGTAKVQTLGATDIPDGDLRRAAESFSIAHGGKLPTSAADLTPYINPPPGSAALETLANKSPADFATDLAKVLGTNR